VIDVQVERSALFFSADFHRLIDLRTQIHTVRRQAWLAHHDAAARAKYSTNLSAAI